MRLFVVFVIIIFSTTKLFAQGGSALKPLLVVDTTVGTVLYQQDDEKIFSAGSLVKLMSAEIVIEAIENKKIDINKKFIVDLDTWKRGGAPSHTTTMFAAENSHVPVIMLLKGLMIVQANDAALALSKGLYGTEENFVAVMNKRAQEIGMTRTHFVNATGLPDIGQYTDLRDSILLLQYIKKHHPNYFSFYKEPSFTWNNITQKNKNFLLNSDFGVDAAVLGYSAQMGYGMVGYAHANNRTVFFGFFGEKTPSSRWFTALKLLNNAFNNFEIRTLYKKGDTIAYVPVFGGERPTSPVSVDKTISALLPKNNKTPIKVHLEYFKPLLAPIDISKKVGCFKIYLQKVLLSQGALMTAQQMGCGGLFGRTKDALYQITIGQLRAYLHL